jgi:hypothetical protein
MLLRLATLRILRLLRVWVACAALSLLPAPGAALALASDVVTLQAPSETAHHEQAPSEVAAAVVYVAATCTYVASRTEVRPPARVVVRAPRRALYLRHCSLLL